jgi:hypothetical protein
MAKESQMSYPPPPGPDKDNPFQAPTGPPPTGYQQPAAGQPPQHPGPPQQAYPAYQQYSGQPAQMPFAPPMLSMPGTVKTARVLLFVFGGLTVLISLGLFYIAANPDDPDVIKALDGRPEAGGFAVLAILALAISALAIVAASMFGKGAGGVRALAIVAGSLLCLSGLFTLPLGLLTIVAGILVIVFCANSNGGAWFKRPRA